MRFPSKRPCAFVMWAGAPGRGGTRGECEDEGESRRPIKTIKVSPFSFSATNSALLGNGPYCGIVYNDNQDVSILDDNHNVIIDRRIFR